jgi:hypothetical protein
VTSLGPWHTEDFAALSWHDVHVHGIRFASFNEAEGAAEFVLDIDYILKWEKSADQLLFTICRAELTFHDVFRLKLELDYATPTAGMCPFAIDGIDREPLELPTGSKSFRWRIAINWPRGSLEFEAPAFTQTLMGKPVVKAGAQSLSSEERANEV